MNEISGRSAPRNLALAFAAQCLCCCWRTIPGTAQDFAGRCAGGRGDRLVNGLVHGVHPRPGALIVSSCYWRQLGQRIRW
jgi:hypothetical protein